jgi:hypothetical protein
LRKRVADMVPVNEVGGAGDLDVDPLAVAERLRRIGVIETVGRSDDGRIGEIAVEDRVHVGGRGRAGA